MKGQKNSRWGLEAISRKFSVTHLIENIDGIIR